MASMRRWSLAAAVFLAAQSQGAEMSPAPSEAVTLGVQIVDIFTCPATLPPGGFFAFWHDCSNARTA